MSRLTSRDYLLQRHLLCSLWEKNRGASFAVLPGQQQRDLHDYYALSVPISDQDALIHRAAKGKAFPSLVLSAGLVFNAFRDHLDGEPNQIVDSHLALRTSSARIGGKQRSLRVLSVSRPTVDHHWVARAFLNLAFDEFDGKRSEEERKALKRKS